MATLGELITAVSLRLKDPDNTAVSSVTVATVINDAIQHWKKKELYFNEFEETVTLVEGDPKIYFNTNTPVILFDDGGVVINYASNRWLCHPVSTEEYDRLNTEGKGMPYVYTYRNGGYEIYHYPDQAYNCVVRGTKDYSAFATDGSANSSSNDFTTQASDLIMYEALSRLFGEFRQDEKMETYYAARTRNEYDNLKQLTNRRHATGRVQVEEF